MILDKQIISSSAQAEQFTREILPQVSRTFDLAIKFLPNKLSRPVGLAYLLCRVADTFEDSAILAPSVRKQMLSKYSDLLANPGCYDRALLNELSDSFGHSGNMAGQFAQTSSPPDHLPSLKLVANLDLVLAAADTMPDTFRSHIFPRVQEMADGMARYTTLASGNDQEINFLQDENDWDNYCYFVAGTVGQYAD